MFVWKGVGSKYASNRDAIEETPTLTRELA